MSIFRKNSWASYKASQNESISPVVLACVCTEAVYLECRLLCSFTTGPDLEFYCPWGEPRDGFKVQWKTPEQIQELITQYSREAQIRARQNLHDEKCSRLGWDYAKRGY